MKTINYTQKEATMKRCKGNGLHEGEPIKYSSKWCPLCAANLLVQKLEKELYIAKRGGVCIKPSRRMWERHGEVAW